MSFSLVKGLLARLKKKSEPNPLVPHHDDLRMVQRLRARVTPGVEQIRHVRRILDAREKTIIWICLGVIALSVVWIGVLGYRHYRIEIPAAGGRYVEGVVGFPQLPNPIFASASDVDSDIVRLVYSGLLRLDERGRLVSDIAASYDISVDKKTYTVTLRKDIVWHDGEKLTARDVVYTIDAIQNRLVGSPLEVTFRGIAVSVLDDYTVRFELKEPFTPFLSALTVGILP